MRIGIIVYSKTGNTYRVAKELKEELEKKGHTVNLERLNVEESSSGKEFSLGRIPEVEIYDRLIFASPVHAFSLAPPMEAFLKKISSLEGKKSFCFVTKQLPFYWTGGNRAITQMTKICSEKGAEIQSGEIVIWGSKKREENIKTCVQNLSRAVSGEE